ncbi:MAG: hypothetical protein HY644_10245 [Acidobacteria bacterium]|nr:hypothetical protein [Acidobacteriota bacterium]
MKHYRARVRSAAKMCPWLFFDVKFDIRDIRTCTCETLERNFQAEMIPWDDDLVWTPDMVVEHGRNFLHENAEPIAAPVNFQSDALDSRWTNKFVEYLMRHYKILVHRNTCYDLYSSPSESIEDFRVRCRDYASQEMSDAFRVVADRYLRRLLQVVESWERAAEASNSDPKETSQIRLEFNRSFLELKERIAAVCLDPEFTASKAVASRSELENLEVKEKLETLERELDLETAQLKQNYRQRVESIDPFPLPLILHQIDIVETAVLWQ